MTTPQAPLEHQRSLPHRLWLVTVMVALAVVLAAVGAAQWRQYKLLDSALQMQHHGLGWALLQLETEQLRLRNAFQKSLDDTQPLDLDALQLRYDIFVSRVGLIDHERAHAILGTEPMLGNTLLLVHEFINEIDHFMGDPPQEPLTRTALQKILRQLNALEVPMHELALSASRLLYERATLSSGEVLNQNKISFALTLFQGLLLLTLAAVVVHQLRTLSQRRARLEAVAENLSSARLEAESASRVKSAFLANMSHEIRTPLHGLLGMISLLQDAKLTPQQAGFLKTAHLSAQHLLVILNDILDLSQLESGRLQINPEPTDLWHLIKDVHELMRSPAQAKGLSFHLQLAPDVPRWVMADVTRVRQILFNLLNNATKFSSEGAVSLSVRVAASSGNVEFIVADSGIGMSEATQRRLFQRFMQADESTSRRHAGTGLGLEISRDLTCLMGGDIEVQSTPGVGSTFTVSLPLVRTNPPTTKGQPDSTPKAAALSSLQGPDAMQTESSQVVDEKPQIPLHVLVAEDHPVNRAYLEAVLQKLGHQAVFSEDGAGAVRAMQSQAFDVVLMDLHMPGMDGFAAARAIRAMPAPRGRVPIVALTADAFQEARDQAREAGMDAFLTKPAHLPQLREVLLRWSHGQDEPPPTAADVAAKSGVDAMPSPQQPESTPPTTGSLDLLTIDDLRQSLSAKKYAALLESFFSNGSHELERLNAAYDLSSAPEWGVAAHSVKGAALSLGLLSVARAAEQIQLNATSVSAAQRSRLLQALQQELTQTRTQCETSGFMGPDITEPSA